MKSNNKKPNVKTGKAPIKKRFSFTRKQMTIGGILGILVLAGAGYWAYSMFGIDSANAGNCTSVTYKKGAKATCVKYAQQMIGISADGVFGSKTASSVKAFQAAHSLSSDGVIGPKTWAALCKYGGNGTAKANAGCGGTVIKKSTSQSTSSSIKASGNKNASDMCLNRNTGSVSGYVYENGTCNRYGVSHFKTESACVAAGYQWIPRSDAWYKVSAMYYDMTYPCVDVNK